MIFLSVGTQQPFDRLARAVDDWAAHNAEPVFGQLGALGADSYRPQHYEWCEFLSAADYARRLDAAAVLVAHVGMGSIISALRLGRPLVMLARRASLGEHRNEHQLATAARFEGRAGLYFAAEAAEVGAHIDTALAAGAGQTPPLAPFAEPQLIDALRAFIQGARP